jgi:hypothetical protein
VPATLSRRVWLRGRPADGLDIFFTNADPRPQIQRFE